ncbi:hypothetical protein ABH15_02315 [Methanoculleus taiwanensis]|uniref:YbhB/YbcL family Raf kinase inhibitor-like protein n=1 Tax=Methanoculleus taiwanensis TaxID=1550565 RepID=A0A498H7F9_9EURY|nr:YbhB/YbcL family Raf kinase inhibitor-like protein [Methanoculleus taiwanensis]RXE57444.1 hypothetical protein ABH15_02315 [Methanoculleus taiwanensis]
MDGLDVRLGFDRFPRAYTCDGDDTSPGITIEGLLTPYLAVILDDPDSSGGTFTHWLIWNIPATDQIPEGIPPLGKVEYPIPAVQGMNDFSRVGYGGPCPARGESHRYFVRVYGMPVLLDLSPGSTRIELETLLRGTATQYGETMALCEREWVPAIPGR